MKNKKENPVAVILKLGSDSKGKYIGSVLLAILGVFFGVLPFLIAAKMIIALMEGAKGLDYYMSLCLMCLGAYILKAFFANLSTSISHGAAFETMHTIREKLLKKLDRMPMGELMDIPSGELKDTIVDRVESLETTLAHIIPEMVANLLIPLCLLVYLFILDWRMALLTLAVAPLGMIFVSTMGKTYPAKFQESV